MLDPLHFFKILIYMGSNMGDLLVVSPVQVHSDIQTQSPFAPWGQKVCLCRTCAGMWSTLMEYFGEALRYIFSLRRCHTVSPGTTQVQRCDCPNCTAKPYCGIDDLPSTALHQTVMGRYSEGSILWRLDIPKATIP